MKIQRFIKTNESYTSFLTNYSDDIQKSISLLLKLKELDSIDFEKIENKLSVYDDNVQQKIEQWIQETPTPQDIAEFALRNKHKWGTEPQMVLYAIEDFASECGIYDDEESDEKGEFYEGSFQFDDDEESENESMVELFEDFEDKTTYEMSGSPKPYFNTKADFEAEMLKYGYYHTTLSKKTDMLIVAQEDLGTLKCKKAEKYGIPVYTYAYAKREMKNLGTSASKYNL